MGLYRDIPSLFTIKGMQPDESMRPNGTPDTLLDITGLPEGVNPNDYYAYNISMPQWGYDNKQEVYKKLQELGALGVGDWSNTESVYNTAWKSPTGDPNRYAFLPKTVNPELIPNYFDKDPGHDVMGDLVLAGILAAAGAAGTDALGLSNIFTPTNYAPVTDAVFSPVMDTFGSTAAEAAGGGSVGSEFLSGGELLDLLPESVKTVTAAELGITDPVALSQALQSPSILLKLIDKVPNLLTSLTSSAAGQAAIGQIFGNIGNKSIRSDLKDILGTIKEQNPFAQNKELQTAAVNALTNPVGQDTLQSVISQMGNLNKNAGYNLATTGSNELAGLFSNPMSNPIMQAVSNLTAENAARRSAAGRGLNAGSMPAEMQDALMAALGGQFANLAGGYSSGINAGSNFYGQEGRTLSDAASAITNAQNSQTNRGKVAGDLVNAQLGAMANVMPGYMNNFIGTNSTAGGVQRVANESANNNLAQIANNIKAGNDIWNEVKTWNLF